MMCWQSVHCGFNCYYLGTSTHENNVKQLTVEVTVVWMCAQDHSTLNQGRAAVASRGPRRASLPAWGCYPQLNMLQLGWLRQKRAVDASLELHKTVAENLRPIWIDPCCNMQCSHESQVMGRTVQWMQNEVLNQTKKLVIVWWFGMGSEPVLEN